MSRFHDALGFKPEDVDDGSTALVAVLPHAREDTTSSPSCRRVA
jgi:hypothetical protein